MADYYPVISRAVSGLDPNTGETRRKVYERARAAIVKQLRAIEPPVSEDDISRERMQLEEAIRRVEAEAGGGDAAKPAPAAPVQTAAAAAPAPAAAKAPAAAAKPSAAPATPAQPPRTDDAARPAGPKAMRPGEPAQPRAAQQRPDKPRPAQARPSTRPDGRPIVQTAGGGKTDARKRSVPLIALGALAVIAVVAGLFAARGQIASLFSGAKPTETAQTTPAPDAGKPAEDKPAEQAASPEAKTDDRLPQDQAGEAQQPASPPAAEQPAAEATPAQQPAAPPAEQQARAPDAAAPAPETPPATEAPAQAGPLVAQRAVLYEEGPNQQSGEALSGSVVWRTESVNGGANQPLDTALKGEIEIPARNLRAIVTIRRNTDSTLPASHTIEIQFKLPPDFPNAGVSNVPGVLMKTDESARGAAVAGLSVKVTNGFFLIGLSNVDSEKSVNEQLLRDRSWIDIPILYDNGRRAVLTLDKGTPGKQAFDQAFDAWKSASSASNPPR